MDFFASHVDYLEQGTEALLTDVSPLLGVIREPLSEEIVRHGAFIARHIESDPQQALLPYGIVGPPAALLDTGSIRDAAMERLKHLQSQLEAAVPAALEIFLRDSTARIRAGLDLCETARHGSQLSAEQLVTALVADTEFHL
ncbi:MAG: hypothetical protein AAFX94_16985, partial [Myxococcota bacterium]